MRRDKPVWSRSPSRDRIEHLEGVIAAQGDYAAAAIICARLQKARADTKLPSRHAVADSHLCDFLYALGYHRVVEDWLRVPKRFDL